MLDELRFHRALIEQDASFEARDQKLNRLRLP